jgi:hypothetical protein
VLTAIIEREQRARRARPAPLTPASIASAWFWMLEAQCYELFRRKHTRRDEAALVETLHELWLRMTAAD